MDPTTYKDSMDHSQKDESWNLLSTDYSKQLPPGFNNSYWHFETDFDYPKEVVRIRETIPWTFLYATLYVCVIFSIKQYMKDRPRYEIRGPLVIWSFTLAVFSIIGAMKTFPELFYMISEYGLHNSMCISSIYFPPRASAFWSYMFTVSKLFEFGDTLFIVLRKQPLIFLHWYHHVTVMIYCYYSYGVQSPTARWFGVINYGVHSVMYTYYTIRALKLRLPKYVSIAVTSVQLLQMFVGTAVSINLAYLLNINHPCDETKAHVTWSLLLYASYIVLFANFFYHAYIKPKGGATGKLRSADTTKKSRPHDMNGSRTYESIRSRSNVEQNNGLSHTYHSNGNTVMSNGTTHDSHIYENGQSKIANGHSKGE